MYPNPHWSSYTQYNVVPGGLATSRSSVPSLDQASLSAAAGLSHGLQPHAALPQRVLTGIPAVNIPRELHSSAAVSQLLGAMSPHMGSFGTQALHKASLSMAAQNQLTYENTASEQQVPVTSAHSTPFNPEKSVLSMESKDPPQAYSSPAVSQSLTQENAQKSWVFYDYLPQLSSNTYAALSGVDLSSAESLSAENQRMTQPPPAHSSVSRHSAIQRNPYSADGIMSDPLSQSGKSVLTTSLTKPSQSHVSTIYAMLDDSQQQQSISSRTASQTPQPQVEAYVIQAQEMKDTSRSSQSSQNPYYCTVTTYSSTTPTNTINMTGSQLDVTNVSYDPVSPAAPLAESQPGEAAFPSTVSLSDINAIRSGCPDPHAGFKSSGSNIHSMSRSPSVSQAETLQGAQPHPSHLLDQLSRGRGGSKSQMQQINAVVNNRHQHSPISRETTQSSMSSLGSPQNMMPTSSIKPVAAPVQAVADSSTAAKPKKPRKPRKPKASAQNDSQPPLQSDFGNNMSPAFMTSSQGFARNSSSYQTQSNSIQQYQQQRQDNQTQMQQQYVNSSQSVMGAHGGSLNSETSYQVLSSVGTNQVSPVSDQSSRLQQQSTETTTLVPMTNARISSSPAKGNSEADVVSGAYQNEQSVLTQNNQYDMQVYSSQPYMEQLVSGQSVRLIPGNLYSESMHVAAGMSVYPYATYQTTEGSTIDTAAFSSLLMDTEANKAEQQSSTVIENTAVETEHPPQAPAPPAAPAVTTAPPPSSAKPSATCTNPLDEDDELCNFARPPPELADKEKPVIQGPKLELPQQQNAAQPSPVPAQKPELKLPLAGMKKTGSAFQDTFLSFLMGQKQETLSSVTATVISERPQLPKYIPEPRRPLPPPPSPPPAPVQASGTNSVAFSDDEEDGKVNVAVKKALSTLDSDSNDSEVQEVQGKYCVQSTKDLTMKITLQNTIKKQNKPRGRPPKMKMVPVGRGIGEGAKSKTTREPTPPPPRESIGRRAKDAAKEKTKKRRRYHESDSSGVEDFDEDAKPIHRSAGSGSEYDSDKDPVWTPSEEEAKRPVGFGFDMSAMVEPKSRKGKPKSKRSHKKYKYSEGFVGDTVTDSPAKTGYVEGSSPYKSSSMGGVRTVHTLPAEDQANNVVDENFQVGQFVLEKKDMRSYESYPIWRLEQGRMLRKFELCMHNGHVCHKAVSTYSSWVPSMQAAYVPIQVVTVSNKTNTEVVEVLEQYRPTPPNDGSLENQFENDPLVESFNIYLQTYLSQALEPSFLEAIRKSRDTFYLDPMEKIDRKIADKLEGIDRLVQWKPNFREAMRTKPQMREIDRPNLKQSCQACEKSSPPTIKSVLFHGAAYDRFLLTDLPGSESVSQEFLVGKFTAPYITQYHSLHHYKHHLLQRCKAKVYMVRESQTSEDLVNESILDRCLVDRTWVLKIFQDFKELLGELK
ncbi:uncharacterized protein LOC143301652 isoform X2 [Babylonia areolata]|uniref:uncharacterized protein LOC143301652 isoform X2 n=1 Tax=Babylonia areolata TaxID=304850 RepID=UPI003FD0545E